MPLLNDAPIPANDAIGLPPHVPPGVKPDPRKGVFLTQPWIDYLTTMSTQVSQGPTRINNIPLSGQQASIAPTDFSGGVLGAGLYRIAYYAQVTQAATISSSLTVTFDWTSGGVAQSLSGAAMTGNTINTVQSGSILIMVDSATPVRYSTTYASAGATPMIYSLFVSLEVVAA